MIGGEKRTLDKYLNMLKNYNLIRVVDIDKFEFAPFVDSNSSNRTYSNDIDDDEFKVDVEGIQR